MKILLAHKQGMSQIFDGEGNRVPVTVLQAGPLVVTNIRTQDHDGYTAVQVGFGGRKVTGKAIKGQVKGTSLESSGVVAIREFRGAFGVERGHAFSVDQFVEGDKISVSGLSKGKGFQGVVKRHDFHGAPKTHGTKHAHRQPGSISGGGGRAGGRVAKGMRMAGRMGGERITVRGLKVVKVDAERNQLYVKGAVPGRRGHLLEVRSID